MAVRQSSSGELTNGTTKESEYTDVDTAKPSKSSGYVPLKVKTKEPDPRTMFAPKGKVRASLPEPPTPSRRERAVAALKREAGGVKLAIEGAIEKDTDVARRRVQGRSLAKYGGEHGSTEEAEEFIAAPSRKGRPAASRGRAKSRRPVPSGRPKRPWIPRRGSPGMVSGEPDMFGFGDVASAMDIGADMIGGGGGDLFGGLGGGGEDLGGMLDMHALDSMMGFGGGSGSKKRRRGGGKR